MFELIPLAIFLFACLMIQIALFERFDFAFLSKGKDITIPTPLLIVIFSTIASLGIFITLVSLRTNSTTVQQYFYLIFFILNWSATLFFSMHTERIYHRGVIALVGSFIITTVSLAWPTQFIQSLYMAGALLWVGPLLFKKLRLKNAYIAWFLVIFTILDVYNVFILNPQVHVPIDIGEPTMIFFGGYLSVGGLLLGMGDFFLSYIAICWMLVKKGRRQALFLAFLVAIPLIVTRIFIPLEFDLPYAPFITVPSLALFYLLK